MKRMIVSSTELERQELLDELNEFAHRPVRKFQKFEKDGVYFEHHSIQHLIHDYIRYFNENVSEYGNGFATDWDSDDWMTILYKNGKIRQINPDCDEGTKKISVDNIDSIIVDGGWGTAFAGPSITFRDETVYDDIVDIRADFE